MKKFLLILIFIQFTLSGCDALQGLLPQPEYSPKVKRLAAEYRIKTLTVHRLLTEYEEAEIKKMLKAAGSTASMRSSIEQQFEGEIISELSRKHGVPEEITQRLIQDYKK